jgi:chromosome segregation ATPase
MNTAIEIKSELSKTDSRITELETQLTEQEATFEVVQQAFIAGKSDINQLHAEQSKLTLFEQAIESLNATYQKLKSAFENQSAREGRAELLKQMADAANQVQPLVDQYLETRSEFHGIVSDYAIKLVEQASTYQAKQAQYQSIVSQLEPTGGEIQESGLDQKTRTMAAAHYFNHAPLEYGEVIALAERLLAAKLNKAAQAKRTAAHNAAKAETATV